MSMPTPLPPTRRRSLATAYVLWLFLGLFGAHRFYLRRWGTGLAMACLTLATLLLLLLYVGLLTAWLAVGWWIIDGFRLSGACSRQLGSESFGDEGETYECCEYHVELVEASRRRGGSP